MAIIQRESKSVKLPWAFDLCIYEGIDNMNFIWQVYLLDVDRDGRCTNLWTWTV